MVIMYEEKYTEDCVNLFVDIFKNKPFNFAWVEEDKIKEYFMDIENTPKFRGYVVIDNNEVKGFCFGVINDYFEVKSYEIKEIAVKKNEQRKGYGSKIILYIEEELSKEGVKKIRLVTKDKSAGHSLYIKQGYINIESIVCMSKNIFN
jgi:aminoglycoside 6'-N-acetyltransferase I